MSRLAVTALTPGVAHGRLAVLTLPLSLWGGFSTATGRIIDACHPQAGRSLAASILAMPSARGSSSSSSALVEAARIGTAPAGIVLGRVDPILVIGSLVAFDLYGVVIPIVMLPDRDWLHLADDAELRIGNDDAGSFIIVS